MLVVERAEDDRTIRSKALLHEGLTRRRASCCEPCDEALSRIWKTMGSPVYTTSQACFASIRLELYQQRNGYFYFTCWLYI
jgi:hypothetical protein